MPNLFDVPLTDTGELDVAALLTMHREIHGSARMEGDGGSGGGAGDGGDGGSGGAGDGGWKAPASQEEMDAIIEKRLNRERSKYAKFDEYKSKAERHDALEAELAGEADKAAKKARDDERAAATNEWLPRAVRAEFRAAAKGALSNDQLGALLEDLDLSKYVTEGGDVDEEKIEKKIKALAGAAENGESGGGGNNNGNQSRNLGQGKQPPSTAKPGDQGRSMAEKRFGDKRQSAGVGS